MSKSREKSFALAAGNFSWRRAGGFTAFAVLTLALGIGTTTAMFSIVDTVILRPLSYAESGRLVMIDEWTPGFGAIPVNALHFQVWRRAATSFQQTALIGGGNVNVTDSSDRIVGRARRASS
jgi:hypothetical protein